MDLRDGRNQVVIMIVIIVLVLTLLFSLYSRTGTKEEHPTQREVPLPMGNNHIKSNQSIENTSPETVNTKENSSKTKSTPNKIKKLLFENQYMRVYYIGSNTEMANHNWKIDGVIIYRGEYYIVLGLWDNPRNLAFRQYNSKKYLTGFTPVMKDEPHFIGVIFNPVKNINKAGVLEISWYNLHSGYLVVIPKQEKIDLSNPKITNVKITKLSNSPTGDYMFQASIRVKLSNSPLPQFIKPLIQFDMDTLKVLETSTSIDPDTGEVIVNMIGTAPKEFSGDNVVLKVQYTLDDIPITHSKIPCSTLPSMLVEEIRKIKKPPEKEHTHITHNVNKLYVLSNIINLEGYDSIDKGLYKELSIFSEYNYMLDLSLRIDVHTDKEYHNLIIVYYSNGVEIKRVKVSALKGFKNITISQHTVIPVKDKQPNIEIKVYGDKVSNDSLLNSTTLYTPPMKPKSLGLFNVTQSMEKTTIQYKPLIPDNQVIRLSDYLRELDQVIRISQANSIWEVLPTHPQAQEQLYITVDNKLYVTNDLNDFIKVLLDNRGKHIKVSNREVTVLNYEELEDIMNSASDKYFIIDYQTSYDMDGVNSVNEGFIKLMCWLDNSPQIVDCIPNGKLPNNLEYIESLDTVLITNATKPTEVVLLNDIIKYQPGVYPILIIGRVNILPAPLVALVDLPPLPDSTLLQYPEYPIETLIGGIILSNITIREISISDITLPLSSGDYIVGETSTGKWIINVDLTKHLNYTIDNFNGTISSLSPALNIKNIFISKDNHIMIQVIADPYDTHTLEPEKIILTDDVSLDITNLTSRTLVQYDYEYKDDGELLIIVQNTSIENDYKFVITLYTQFDEIPSVDDFEVIVNGSTSPETANILIQYKYDLVTIIVNADKTTQSIKLKINDKFVDNTLAISVEPIVTNLQDFYLMPIIPMKTGIAVIGDSVIFYT